MGLFETPTLNKIFIDAINRDCDNVQHPNHYTNGEIEVIDYIRDKLSAVEFIGYCIGNVLKYVSRWKFKGGVEDLEKAAVYLNWAIERAKDGGEDAA